LGRAGYENYTSPKIWGDLGGFGWGFGGAGILRRGGLRGDGLVHAPPPPLAAPPNFFKNWMILAYLLKILVFFGEIFLYLKLKWSSLGSPLKFSFYENLTTIKIKQEWQ
jgi:hypothetical protein